jgi:hypothetical protein
LQVATVTVNLKHFLSPDLQPWNLEAQSPDTFLTHLYDLDPEGMVEVVRGQAEKRKQPVTVWELLDKLKKPVPQFTAKVQADFS